MTIVKFIDLVKTPLINHVTSYHDAAIQATYSKCLIGSVVSKFYFNNWT